MAKSIEFKGNIPQQERGTLKLLQAAGFTNIKATYLRKAGEVESAETAAKGFIR